MNFRFVSFVCIILVCSCHSHQSKAVSANLNSPSSDSNLSSSSIRSDISKPLSLNLTTLSYSVPEDSDLSNDGVIFYLNEGDSGEILSTCGDGVVISIDDSVIWFKECPSRSEDTSNSIDHYCNENYELQTDLISLKKDSNDLLPPLVGTMTLKAKDGRVIVRNIKGIIPQ